MLAPQVIIIIFWAIFFIYWALNWSIVKPSKKTDINIAEVRIIFAGLAFIFLLERFVLKNSLNLPRCRIDILGCPQLFFLQIAGLILAVHGLIVALIARKTIAGNWSPSLDLKKDHKLVTTGIYGYIRHPIYAGILLLTLGSLFVFQSLVIFFAFTFMLLILAYRIKKEEEFMEKNFPKDYPKYKKRVKALVPFVL